MTTKPALKESIQTIAPFKVGDSGIDGVDEVIKLSANENPLGPSPMAVEALQRYFGNFERYPDPESRELRATIAAVKNIPENEIAIGSASDQLLQILISNYAGPGDEILQGAHSFLLYRIAALSVGAVSVFAPEPDLCVSVDELLTRVTDRTKILIIANPGNPTGTWIPLTELKRLRDELRSDILLIIDSAYAEYVVPNSYEAGHSLVHESVECGADNVVVTRTFSKMYGLAALRVGWCHGPESVIDGINRVRSPFNVNAPAQIAGTAAIKDHDHVRRSFEYNRKCLPHLTSTLEDLGLHVPSSGANFVLVRFPDGTKQATAANARLIKHGVIVAPAEAYGLPDCLRVTIGTEEENERFLEVLH